MQKMTAAAVLTHTLLTQAMTPESNSGVDAHGSVSLEVLKEGPLTKKGGELQQDATQNFFRTIFPQNNLSMY